MSETAEVVTNVTPQIQEDAGFTAGDGAVSFDELDQLSSRLPKDEKQETQDTEQKEEPDETEDKKDDAADQEQEKSDDQEKLKKAVEKVKPQGKAIKVKQYGTDQEVDLDGSTELEVKVNGQIEKVPLRDVINNYSGKKHIAQELSKLRQEQQAFGKTADTLQGYINEITNSLLVEKDMQKFITSISEVMGADPAQAVDIAQEMMQSKFKEWSEQDENQRAISLRDAKLKALEETQQRQQQAQATSRHEAEMLKKAHEYMQQKGLSEEEYRELAKEVMEKNNIQSENLTPEAVAEYHSNKLVEQEAGKTQENILKILEDINPGLDETSKASAIDQLKAVKQFDETLSEKDLRDVAIEVWGNKKAKTLSKKLKRASMPTNTARIKNVDNDNAPLSFDDI